MTLNIFGYGGFTNWPTNAEWDGTNEDEILAWIRGMDPSNDGISEEARWQIAATSPSLVLARPAIHPAGYATQVTVPLNFWVSAAILTGTNVLFVQWTNPIGKWKTATDASGHPEDLNDLLYAPPAE